MNRLAVAVAMPLALGGCASSTGTLAGQTSVLAVTAAVSAESLATAIWVWDLAHPLAEDSDFALVHWPGPVDQWPEEVLHVTRKGDVQFDLVYFRAANGGDIDHQERRAESQNETDWVMVHEWRLGAGQCKEAAGLIGALADKLGGEVDQSVAALDSGRANERAESPDSDFNEIAVELYDGPKYDTILEKWDSFLRFGASRGSAGFRMRELIFASVRNCANGVRPSEFSIELPRRSD